MKTEHYIEELKKSVMFNLSLSSKELFHSNFINWLIEINKEGMNELFKNLLGKEIIIKTSKREKDNFDLFIPCEDNTSIVIENKFKSIVTKKQLEEYNLKFKKDNKIIKILLTLNSGKFEEELTKELDWKLITYNEFIIQLKKINFINPYHNEVVKDYCNYVLKVIDLLSEVKLENRRIKDMYDDYDNFKKIRLHDISQKILFNKIFNELNHKLTEKNIEITPEFNLSKKFFLFQGFTRGTGFVCLNNTINYGKEREDGFRLEVQLQFNSLKLMVINPNFDELNNEFKDSFFKILEKYSEKYSERDKNGNIVIYPKNNDYNKYGRNIRYKSIKLHSELLFSEIIDLMIKIFEEIIIIGNNIGQKNETLN